MADTRGQCGTAKILLAISPVRLSPVAFTVSLDTLLGIFDALCESLYMFMLPICGRLLAAQERRASECDGSCQHFKLSMSCGRL